MNRLDDKKYHPDAFHFAELTRSTSTPESKLCAAIILRSLFDHLPETGKNKRDAVAFFRSDAVYPCSFRFCCLMISSYPDGLVQTIRAKLPTLCAEDLKNISPYYGSLHRREQKR